MKSNILPWVTIIYDLILLSRVMFVFHVIIVKQHILIKFTKWYNH